MHVFKGTLLPSEYPAFRGDAAIYAAPYGDAPGGKIAITVGFPNQAAGIAALKRAPSASGGFSEAPDPVAAPVVVEAVLAIAPVEAIDPFVAHEPAPALAPTSGHYDIGFQGLPPAQLVDAGHAVLAALSGKWSCAEPPTGWAKGSWCLYGDCAMSAGELEAVARGVVPAGCSVRVM